MMESDLFERDSDHLLVEGQLTDELLAPLKRSGRLKYNCISVSNKLVAIGSNTGGIYIFSRTEQKLLQIAFAEKETNSVSLVKISPHEKYVAFVSASNVYVLDLKLESRSKAETLRSTSDLSDRMVTCLLWDKASSKLFMGDDLGKVSMMPVYSNKAKNLFSLPLEVIMKLDSAIVQLDKAEEKILVSTLTRCYLCDTTRQQYSQIGKKLRDGQFGACFLTQGTSAPMIYCARPGSRVWEVDFDGNVLNTHQFKQLLAVAPSPVVSLDQKYRSRKDNSDYKGQQVAFPRLVTLRNNFLLSWTPSSVYILDPINVKVILWANQFSGIQDICCVDRGIYLFFDTMVIQCINFHAVTSIIPMYMKANDIESASNMCIDHRNVFLHKHVRKKFGIADLYKIYDKLVSEKMAALAEQIHEVIVNVENKVASESETETSSSGRSRSDSAISRASTGSSGATGAISGVCTGSGGPSSAISGVSSVSSPVGVVKRAITDNIMVKKSDRETENERAEPSSDDRRNVNEMSQNKTEMGQTIFNSTKTEIIDPGDQGKEVYNIEQGFIDKTGLNKFMDVDSKTIENDQEISANMKNARLEKVEEMHNDITDENKNKTKEAEECALCGPESSDVGNVHMQAADLKNGSRLSEKVAFGNERSSINEPDVETFSSIEGVKGVENHKMLSTYDLDKNTKFGRSVSGSKSDPEMKHSHNATNHDMPDAGVHKFHIAMETVEADADINVEIEDDVGLLPAVALGQRRLSLTSLSSIDSGDVYLDQPFENDLDESSDKIGIPIRRKSGKKKRRRSSAVENTDNKADGIAVRMTRSLSAGTMQLLSNNKERSLSPQGSAHSVKEEDSISVYSNDSLIEDGNTDLINNTENRQATEDYNGHKGAESGSTGIPFSDSGDFGLSGEFKRSGEYLQSGEYSPRDTTLSQSWERNKQGTSPSAPKAAFLQLKNRMQTKVTSGTKNLIKNIKEKNLLSKAKGFAENLSQGSEAYLHSGEAPYSETPDIQMSHPDFVQHQRDSQGQGAQQPSDTVDSIDKGIVDCADLERITAETREKIEDIQTLMNTDTVYKVLSDWVTSLNKSFQELHLKKYGTLADSKVGGNSSSDSNKENNTSCNDRNGGTFEGLDGHKEDQPNDTRNIGTRDFEAKEDTVKKSCIVRNTEAIVDVLSDRKFCYHRDPLHLSSDVLQDICEFTQACFDLGCHGDILKFIESRKCDQSSNGNVKYSNVCVTEYTITAQEVENAEINDGNKESESPTSKDESVDKKSDTEHKGFENTEEEKENKSCDTVCDNTNNSDPSAHSEHDPLKEYHECDSDNEDLNAEKVVQNSTDNKLGGEDSVHVASDSQYKKLSLSDDRVNENIEKENADKVGVGQTLVVNDEKVVEDGALTSEPDGRREDNAMGFFVRCYFPYLSVLRVREEILKRKGSFHLWSALLVCMEGKARYYCDKYGIADTSVINYLLENQAATDQGAMLLGHISSIFDSNMGSVVDLCVRCHPFIHPVDVMYLCRYHHVAMETLFKQYMILMTMDETSAIKEHILLAVGRHQEASLAWFDLLLTEDEGFSKVMDEHGCPRCMAHKARRKNEGLICELTNYIQEEDDKRLVLELFRKHGYWAGVLKFLKESGPRSEHLQLVLQLRDVDLLNGHNDLGYEAQSVGDWQEILDAYQNIVLEQGNQSTQEVSPDWSKLITWNNLAILLARHIGSEEAVSLLDKHDIPEGELSPEFYQVCLLSGMVHRQQRLVLHSMLEKVDSYLWSQRPTALTPQLLYLATVEKKGPSLETSTSQSDLLQTMVGSLKGVEFEQFVEDPECHWGIETKINLLCPCCSIALKETVSNEEPGVLIFRCGHGYHKFCLPFKECILCDESYKENSTEKVSFI